MPDYPAKPPPNNSIILLGGTFDPIHQGHVNLACQIASKFNNKVTLLPIGGTPTYKPFPIATTQQRIDMLKLIVKEYNAQITLDTQEIFNKDYTPTIITAKKIRQTVGPIIPIYFIIGVDSLISLDIWDNYQELFNYINFIAIARSGYTLDKMSPELSKIIIPKISLIDTGKPNGQVILTDFPPINISSTAIRNLINTNYSTENMLNPRILEYIEKNNLYKD